MKKFLALGFLVILMTALNVQPLWPADLNEQLMEAAESGNAAQVKKLLDQGANPNYMRGVGGRKVSSGGYTVLMNAAHEGHLQVVKILLDHGAKVNLTDSLGVTALIEASTFGYDGIVKLLIKAGADVNIRTKDGYTALRWALRNAAHGSSKSKAAYAKTIDILRQNGAIE